MRHPLYACLLCLSLPLLNACESYDFRVNDKLVYTPRPLFSDFSATDPALQQCLEQAISDGKVSNASELDTLNCSHAGVSSLDGLEVFTGISQLKLSSNTIRDISALSALTSLVVLQLDDNQIIDTTPLLELRALKQLNLAANPQMLCPASSSLITLEQLTLPEQCK